jgi:photosystem II stability/assembly factor-like uncharacterized protein
MKKIILLIAMVVSLSQMGYSEWKLASEAVKGSFNSFVATDNKFYASRGYLLYQSTDNGATWLSLKVPAFNKIYAISADKDYICLGTDKYTYVSSNIGKNWTRVNVSYLSTEIYSVLIKGNYIYAGNTYGVMINKNRDTLWEFTNDGMINGDIICFTSSGNKIYVGSKSNGVCYSTDDGVKWIKANKGLGNDSITALAVAGTKLYAGTRNGVYVSTNDGVDWTDISQGLTKKRITALAVKDNNVFAGTYYSGVFSLSENTSVWKEANQGIADGTPLYISSLLVIGDTLFAGYQTGIYKSCVNEWITDVENQKTVETSLSVYPNPARDNITISLSNSAVPIQKLSIYNSLGIEIKQFDTKDVSTQNSINFSTAVLPSGIYQCVVTSGYERIMKSFVVMR